MRRFINIITEAYVDIEALGDLEVPMIDGHGKQYGTSKLRDMSRYQVGVTYLALKRKRNAAAVDMRNKIGQWLDHLADEDRRQEDDYKSRWVERLPHVYAVRVIDEHKYAVSVNDPKEATYIALYCDGKRVGFITTRPHDVDGVNFTGIGKAEIDKAHRGKRLGLLMYRALLAHTQTAGIASYLPDRSNRTQVPKIYKRLGGYVKGDYAIIPKP